MNRHVLVAWALCSAGSALAQESEFSVSVGARAWVAEWSTFSYYSEKVGGVDTNRALTQVSANDKSVLVPLLSVRYGNFVGSVSAYPTTSYSFKNGSSGTRQEFDANAGYTLTPGLTATLGYKKVVQRGGKYRYEPGGPVAGVSAFAPLSGAISVYGALGVGRLKTPDKADTTAVEYVRFTADYRLTEVGLAYTLRADRLPRLWTFSAGYRMQVLRSMGAFGNQDGRDITQGWTLGAVATF